MKPDIFLYNIDTNYLISKHTGEVGVIKCKEIFHRIGWIPRVINQQDDIGIDLLVETTKKNINGKYIPQGQLFGIQVKAGRSYYYKTSQGKDYFILTSSKEHQRNWDYWCNHQLPVFVFFYYDDLKIYSLFNINKWAISEEDWDNDKPLPIKSYNLIKFFEKNGSGNLRNIKKKILRAIKEKGDLSNVISLIDSVYYDGNKSLESIMILSENYQTRSSSILALLFPHILFSRKDNVVREAFKVLIDRINVLRLLPDHMESMRKLYNKIINDLSIYIWGRILSVVIEHEFYSIEPEDDSFLFCNCPGPETISFLTEIDDYKSLFLKLAKSNKFTQYVRINALAIYFFGSFVVNYYVNNDDYGPEWENFSRDYLLWNGIHIKDYFLERNVRAFLSENNLLVLVANYYNINLPEIGNRKMDEFLMQKK